MNIKNQTMAKYVENAIQFRDLTSLFLFEESDDMHIFLKEVRDKENLVVHGALVPNKSLNDFKPPVPIEDLKFVYSLNNLLFLFLLLFANLFS